VVGTSSPIPYVRSLAPEAVQIYREKLKIEDLRGEEQPDIILAHVEVWVAEAPSIWAERWQPPVPTTRLPAGGGMSGMGSRFSPDPAGLFLIGTGPSGRTIHAEHYTREGVLDRRVIGDNAQDIAATLVGDGLLGDVGHATYVGRELQKAELALRLGLSYEQDRDLVPPRTPA
jgi:tetrahydromethanopterin S-methyltransferase subunit A